MLGGAPPAARAVAVAPSSLGLTTFLLVLRTFLADALAGAALAEPAGRSRRYCGRQVEG